MLIIKWLCSWNVIKNKFTRSHSKQSAFYFVIKGKVPLLCNYPMGIVMKDA